jgi:L-cysteine:1D-myo-inositol 2-amino-2-deoxy-alpha-D-glucopyranoside ligase
MAIRWALMKDHYRKDRMWTEQLLIEAETEISALRLALSQATVAPTTQIIPRIVALLADDLDTQSVVENINEWVAQSHGGSTGGDAHSLIVLLDALLGIKL